MNNLKTTHSKSKLLNLIRLLMINNIAISELNKYTYILISKKIFKLLVKKFGFFIPSNNKKNKFH